MKEKNIKKFKNILKNNNGITLIALVITIIVMLILVGVTISMAVNGGLFGYAGNAARDTELAKQEELKIAQGGIEVDGKQYNTIDKYMNGVEETPKYSQDLLDSDGVLTKTAEYTDANNETAIIPAGYAILTGCETINTGLVISDEFNSSGNSIGNEFVWIPVPEKNMKVATTSDPYKEPTSSYYSEPTILTYDTQENLNSYYGLKADDTTPYYTLESDFAYEAHYKEMAESVNKYRGFYIGRYETTIDIDGKIGTKLNKTILTPDKKISGTDKDYRWWGLYYAARNSNVAGNGTTVQTNMIWGQQWDKMIRYFDSKTISYEAISLSTYSSPQRILRSGQARYINKTNSSDEKSDIIFNIYDLRMNAFEWTAEASNTGKRVLRGSDFRDRGFSASFRDAMFPYISSLPGNNISPHSPRLTLYIK